MPDFCTCGTQLVENASFCHRCGRPTREISVEQAEPAPTPPPLPKQEAGTALRFQGLPMGFSNPLAVRVAFVMSLAAMLLELIPVVNLLFVIWWLGAGWCAVAVYRRLTGAPVTVAAGARLGSITGVLTFVSMAIMSALTVALMGTEFREQMIKQDPRMTQVMSDPVTMTLVVVMATAVMFAMIVGTCAAGGALGAKFPPRSRPA
jgi:hypothetical protein